MPEVAFNIEVYCGTCGEGLCNQTEFVKTRTRYEPSLRVEACKRCLDQAKDEGYNDGYQSGYQEARDQVEDVE